VILSQLVTFVLSAYIDQPRLKKNDILCLCEAFPYVEHLYVNVSSAKYMRLQFNLTTVHFLCSSIEYIKVKREKTKVSLLNWLHGQQWHFTFHSENALIAFSLSNRWMKEWWDKKR
jgi:hypothetical protein